jgi:hypothetical protein
MFDKLHVYFQPVQGSPESTKSFSISYYDFDTPHNTYRIKVVREEVDAKYKIKMYMGDLGSLIPLLKNLNLNNMPKNNADLTLPYFYVQWGSESYTTNDKVSIQKILDIVRFDEFYNYELSQYKVCE